ncbi:MAG: alpha/beta fold hydrolase [Deltaproteobacteria bacterium]|nr:MAG: alpha/beta fold hydrolase [Deltaproteobacteria bacterium]
MLEFIPQAVERVREITGEAEVSMVGWSMGGIMILLYTAIHEERPGGSGVRNIVTLGSPVDFGKLFPFNILIHFAHSPLSRAIDLFGNIPPFLTRNGFKLLAPLASLRRYRLLWEHYYDREWVAGFETIQDWADSFIPYPGAAFKQFITDFIKEDKLRSKKLEIGEHVVDLSRVKSALLAFSGTTDKVAVPPSVDPVVELVGSSDTTIEHVPLGHIGMVAGSGAPKYVWAPMTAWLAERSKPVASEQPRASKKAMRRRRTRRPPERGTSKTLPPDSSI